MEPTDNKSRTTNKELSIADLLCSAGYLPPRNERDVERFERIYSNQTFETEAYIIKANAIFNKVTSEDKATIRRFRPMSSILDCPGALRVADSISSEDDNIVEKTLSQLIIEKNN